MAESSPQHSKNEQMIADLSNKDTEIESPPKNEESIKQGKALKKGLSKSRAEYFASLDSSIKRNASADNHKNLSGQVEIYAEKNLEIEKHDRIDSTDGLSDLSSDVYGSLHSSYSDVCTVTENQNFHPNNDSSSSQPSRTKSLSDVEKSTSVLPSEGKPCRRSLCQGHKYFKRNQGAVYHQPQTKFQQPDDQGRFQADQQPLYNMGRPFTTTKVIGPNGGIIELLRYKVLFKPNSLTEERKIELSLDSDPCNFPKEGVPITSILEINPSMKLEVPAIVTMPTTCTAATGEAPIQIWSKEEGQDWEKCQTVWLANKSEISFETDHFSGRVGTSVDGKEGDLAFAVKNQLFIQKDTGTILSVFWQDDVSMDKFKKECTEDDYKRVVPGIETWRGKINSKFQVHVECEKPENIKYSPSQEEKPAVFVITEEFLKSRTPVRIFFTHENDRISDNVLTVHIKYSVNPVVKARTYPVKWPLKIGEGSNPHIQVSYNKSTTGIQAETGGVVQGLNGGANFNMSG